MIESVRHRYVPTAVVVVQFVLRDYYVMEIKRLYFRRAFNMPYVCDYVFRTGRRL